MPPPLPVETIARAPKVLLHDHLDGGLRPQTVLELADEAGYRDLPAGDAEDLGRWFRQAADSGSLVRYLETFTHTVAVMQRPEAIHRVARECALDLAADGVVYAEVRFAPELSTARGLAIEAVVEAMVDGFAAGVKEAAPAIPRIFVVRPAGGPVPVHKSFAQGRAGFCAAGVVVSARRPDEARFAAAFGARRSARLW